MRNITENFWNSTTGSNLYCVWVPVHADGGNRLVTIWIDRGLTAFQSQMQENPQDIDTTVQTHARHDEDRGDQYEVETLNFILPVRHLRTRSNARDTMAWHVFAIRLLIALLFGALIGAERQWRQRMAGLRTNALVAAGAAMFVMMGGLIAGDGSEGRVAAYVVSGIGFLGGGVILKDGMTIRGLNTAATLWCTAAIGTLSGLGAERFSLVGTLGVIAANILLRPVGKAINRDTIVPDAEITYLFRITARAEQESHMRALLLHSLGGQPLLLRSLKSEDVEHTDKVEVHATLTSTGRQNLLLEQLVSRLSLESGVSGVSWEIVGEHE